MNDSNGKFYEFGPFRVDLDDRLLFRGDEVVPLTPKAFDLLLVLVESGGHVVTKDELMNRVWPDTFVEEANLSRNVYILREALGEGSNDVKFIETLPRRGYRFVAKVGVVQSDIADLVIEEHSHQRIVVEEEQPERRIFEEARPPLQTLPAHVETNSFSIPKPVLMIIIGLVVIGVLTAAFYLWRARKAGAVTSESAGLHSIAVLPFKPLVANDRDESLEMGMADTLIARLSRIGQLTVRPTNAVRQYNRLEDEAVKAGRELNVDAILDGNIQKTNERIRVSVRLIRVDQGITIWTEQFDENFTNIFAVQDAISGRVAEMLAVRLSTAEKTSLAKRSTDNSEAYQLYLRGRYHWNKRTPEGITRAVDYFSQAIKLDPSYAAAYAGLADAYCMVPEFSNGPFRESIAKAKAASEKAIALDDSLAEAHISLAYVRHTQWDWRGAEEEYRRGLALNPNYATGHQWYSEYLVFTGRTDEALREIKIAQQLEPLSLIINTRIGMTLYYSRKYDEAIDQLRKTLEFDPEFFLAHIFLYASFYEKGMHRESIPHIVKGFLYFYSPQEKTKIETQLIASYEASGKDGLWKQVLGFMKSGEGRDYHHPYTLAETYMRLNDKDKAFFWLQKAYEIRHPGLAGLKVEPAMDGLRDDPRFAEFLRRLDL